MPVIHSFILYVDDPGCAEGISLDARFAFKLLRPSLYPLWEQCLLPLQARRDKLDILHCPGNTAPIVGFAGVPIVLTLHDTIFLQRRDAHAKPLSLRQRLQELYYRLFSPLSARGANAIITVSEYSRGRILAWLPNLRCEVLAIHSGPGAFQRTAVSTPLPRLPSGVGRRPFIFALGAADPRKNTELVLRAFSKYARFGHCEEMIIAGLDEGTMEKLRARASSLGISDRTTLLGFVAETELAALFEQATMFIFPSLAEGFGFPPLEAMSHGALVVASRAGAVPEVVGDAAVFFDPNDPDALAEEMSALSKNPQLQLDLRRRGRIRVKNFSWARTAHRTLDVYVATARRARKLKKS